MDQQLRGIYPVFQTPFLEDETIDYATLAREIEWLFERGSNGIVMAMVSELLRLSHSERMKLAEAACKLGTAHGDVIISVGAESTRVAVELAQQAEAVGATAVMINPPVTVTAEQDELLGYFGRIIEAIGIPAVVQDASGYVGKAIPVELYSTMIEEWGDRVYFKPEATPIGPRLSQLRDATNGKARVFEGTGGIALVDSYRRGIVGTMPGADLIDAIVALWKALEAGDESRIYRISCPLIGLVNLCTTLDSYLAIEKHLLVRQGIFRNTRVRGPVGYKLDEETRKEVDRMYDVLREAIG